MEHNILRIRPFGKPETVIDVAQMSRDLAGHGGGDGRLIAELLQMHGNTGRPTKHMTTLEASAESHHIAFAAEQSRKNGGMAVELANIRD